LYAPPPEDHEAIVATFPAVSQVRVLDDTLSPKWGRGIFGTAFHFDHASRPRAGYKGGQKPRHGPWLPRLSRLARQRSKFKTLAVAIYGKTVTLRLREMVAWWPPLACEVKVVIARDPKRPKRVAYLVTTDLALTAVEVVEAFARRWTIEQMFSVAKNPLGFDSAEVRKERSVPRHAALALALDHVGGGVDADVPAASVGPAVRGQVGGRPGGGCDADPFRFRPPAQGLTPNCRHPSRMKTCERPVEQGGRNIWEEQDGIFGRNTICAS